MKTLYQQTIRKWDLCSEDQFGLFDEAQLEFGPEWTKEENDRIKSFKQFSQFECKISESMKQQARYGIPIKKRRQLWLVASGGFKLLTHVGDVWQAAKQSSESISPSEKSKFGSTIEFHTLFPEGISQKIDQFLHVLWTQNQEINYSPLIPTVSALLLLYMEVPLAYISIQSMINKSRQESWYFTLTQDQLMASLHAFDQLVKKKCPSVSHHAKSLNVNIAQIGMNLLPAFFLLFLPLPIALTLFDSFTIEGRKVLFRFCLNLFIQEKKNLLNCKEAKNFVDTIISAMQKLHNIPSFKTFVKNSFNIFLSRSKHIDEIEASAIESQSFQFSDSNLFIRPSSYSNIASFPNGPSVQSQQRNRSLSNDQLNSPSDCLD